MTGPVRAARSSRAYLLLLGLLVCTLSSIHLWVGPEGGPAAHPQSAPVLVPTAPGAGVDLAAWRPAPVPADGSLLRPLDKGWFRIGYDEVARNPGWVAYLITGGVVHHEEQRRPSQFATDRETAAQVTQRDYSGSGFDRGHLCPAYAMFSRHGGEAQAATFVMSNVVPQAHEMNAGVWRDLELEISGERGWAARFQGLWVLAGPLYDRRPAARRLGNGTWVPDACWMVVLRRAGQGIEPLAFIVPNTATAGGPPARHLVALSEVELRSGLDLLGGLPAEVAAALRALPAPAAGW